MEELKYQYERLRSEYFQSIVRNERIKRNFKEIKRNYNETPVEITDKQINIKLCNIKNLNIKIEINENKCDCFYCQKITSMNRCFVCNRQSNLFYDISSIKFEETIKCYYCYEKDTKNIMLNKEMLDTGIETLLEMSGEGGNNKYDIEDIRIFNAMDELKEKHKNDSIDIKKFFLLFSHLLRMAYDYEFDDIFEILFFQKTDITMSIRHSTEENIFKKYLFK